MNYETLYRGTPDDQKKAVSQAHGYGFDEASVGARIDLLRHMKASIELALTDDQKNWCDRRIRKILDWADYNNIPVLPEYRE